MLFYATCRIKRQPQERHAWKASEPTVCGQRARASAGHGPAHSTSEPVILQPHRALPPSPYGLSFMGGTELSCLHPQGLLRAEAPLLLEIFAALFETVDPKALVDASSTPTANLPPAQPPLAPHQAQQRHPRFGGIFVSWLEGGRARCSVGKSQHQDVLGHVAASGKLAGTTKVRMSLPAKVC